MWWIIDSPDWIKNKKATINPINKKDNKCFQYPVTNALNYEEIKKDPQRITRSPWELMDPRTKNDSDKTQDIRILFDPF